MIGIRVQSQAGQAPGTPQAAWFDRGGGDIGRSSDCTLVLSDPERHISRRHAAVLFRDGGFYLRLLSGGLPVDVDGRVLQVGDELPLGAGAHIQIGGYRLEVLDEPDSLGLPSRDTRATPHRSDFDALLDAVAPLATPAAAPEIDLLVGETGGSTPPRPAPRIMQFAASLPAGLPPAPPADAAAAMLAGLGLPQPPGGAFGPAQWQTIGALLRTMTGGLLDLLTARMVAKREFGAEGTQLRSRENNPLKFSPDVDAALAHLLGPAERGFLPPVQAAQEAIDDLRAHQLALLAGMRAALDAVMSRFDPAAFEQRMAPEGAWESLIPSQHKARLWDAYCQQFGQIVGQVEGDFDALLGRAFLKAYQAQLAELAGAPGPGRWPG